MSMQDSVADFLTRIRNGQAAKKKNVMLASSTQKVAIAKVLKDEGYIDSYEINKTDPKKPELNIVLKYYKNVPVISRIRRISRPGLRIYKAVEELPSILGGLGIAIISTSKGIVSDKQAKKLGAGGEVLCFVE